MIPPTPRTLLAFQRDGKLQTLTTTLLSIKPFTALEDPNRQLFKQANPAEDHVLITSETIFHPQGGGQPSDEGTMTSPTGGLFTVTSVRMDAVHDGQVLHLGHFNDTTEVAKFTPSEPITQSIDVEKRLLYSRLHTAGHVLGSAVRHLLEHEVDNFEELKASHFPDSASCEFQGLIDGKWKAPIQAKVDAFLAAKMPVEVEWWDEGDFRAKGMERLIPSRELVAPGEKFRVVHIVGAEVYPCGGTHVETTDLCGEVVVKKIARKQGNSKVSYGVK